MPKMPLKFIFLSLFINNSFAQDEPNTSGFFGGGEVSSDVEFLLGDNIIPILDSILNPADSVGHNVTFGKDVPDHLAMEQTLSISVGVIDLLDDLDRSVVLDAISNINDAKTSFAELLKEEACRNLILISPNRDQSDIAQARILAGLLVETDKLEREYITKEFDSTLKIISPSANSALLELKDKIHLNLRANESDWDILSEKDPEGFVYNWKINCQLYYPN